MELKYKKHLIISFLVTTILILSTVTVLAQDQSTPQPVPKLPRFGGAAMRGWHGGMWSPHHGAGMMDNFSLLEVVAQKIGISFEEVWEQLATGISIADLAASYDVDVQIIVDATLSQHQVALDNAVTNGWLSTEQATWMRANMANMLAWRINQPWGMGSGYGNHSGNNYGPGGCYGRQFAPPASTFQGNDA